ncbi:hypothetical protein CHS0354_009327 [Potamilus streckersoni]|uniref:Peptidoglycan-recognition protein n=1 Tax=Potamilus streckersoni TaxID=2493646 RepID=A0AAE0SNI0_9BIVA|nr:hypothetical protein CHS0354_009327 [Potamilus streckersoni]
MKLILLQSLFWMFVFHRIMGEDSGCQLRGGKCQKDNLHCSGYYVNGLCSSYGSRRCCFNSRTDPISCTEVKIVSRSDWGAVPPTNVSYLKPPVDLVFIHHTDTQSCSDLESCSKILRSIQYFHMHVRGWADIAYSFLVGEDGNAYEGRGWDLIGSHTKGYNDRSLGFAFIGNYSIHLPPATGLSAAMNLIKCGIENGKITPDYCMYGHRDVRDTSCPGEALYREIRTWTHYNCTDSTLFFMGNLRSGTRSIHFIKP